MDIEKLIERLHKEAYGSDIEELLLEAATAIETLRAENVKLQYEAERQRRSADDMRHLCENAERAYTKAQDDLARVTAERDAAVKAVKNMAEYIVCAGRVDYYLCDEISQEHHLKYQPKNDGNYDNEPCYKCIADWFLQGHEWQENC